MGQTRVPKYSDSIAWVTTHLGTGCGQVVGAVLDHYQYGVEQLLGASPTGASAHSQTAHIATIKQGLKTTQHALYPTDSFCGCDQPRKPASYPRP